MDGKELLRALMRRSGLNPNALANILGRRSLQSQVTRFLDGSTANPRWSTLKPVADHFEVKVEAFFDSELAEQVATQKGLVVDRSPFSAADGAHQDFATKASGAPTPIRHSTRISLYEVLMQLADVLEKHDLSARKAVASLLGDLAIAPEQAATTADRIQRLLDEPGNGRPQKSTHSPSGV